MVQWYSAGLEIHRSQVQTPMWPKKKNLSQVQSEQYHHQSLCTRVKYLKLSEVKTRSCHGAVVQCRTRCRFKPPCGQKRKISHRSNPIPPPIPCTRVKYLKLSEVKTRSCHGAVVQCRTRDPQVPGSNPHVAKKEKSLTGPIRTIPPPIPLHQS